MHHKVIEENVRRYSNVNTRDHILRNLYDGYYNCWGFTACMVGWIDYLDWIRENQMTSYLLRYTEAVEKPMNGDIAVYVHRGYKDTWMAHRLPIRVRDEDGVLSHTAIVINADEGLLIQKPGGCRIGLQDFAGKLSEHNYGPIVEFRRPTTYI